MLRGALLTALLTLISCSQQAAIHVVVEGDLVPGQEFDLIALRVLRAGEEVPCIVESVPASHGFPYAFNLVSGEKTPPGTPLKITARAVRGTQLLAESSAEDTLSAGQLRQMNLKLSMQSEGTADGPCTVDFQCGAERYCRTSDGTCVARLPLAMACSSNSECGSGFCADGVCCNAACDGSCDVCNGFGSEGTCTVLSASALGQPSCSPAFCSGGSGSCASSCANDFECVSSGFCSGGSCQDKKANGQSCSRAGECSSGFCADGFCCNSACGGACDVCNATPGTCTFATRGSAGSPSCGLFACTGSSASCATSCGGGQSCGPGITCVGATCVPKTASLRDDFQDNSRDGSKWNTFSQGSGGAVAERNGRVEVTISSSLVYAGYESVGRYDLTGSSVSTLIFSAGDQSLASFQPYILVRPDASHSLTILIGQNQIHAEIQSGPTTYEDVGSTPYPASGKYLRIREQGGTIQWQTSTNNTDWTTFASRSVSSLNFALTQLIVEFGAGTFNNEPSLTSTVASFEAINP